MVDLLDKMLLQEITEIEPVVQCRGPHESAPCPSTQRYHGKDKKGLARYELSPVKRRGMNSSFADVGCDYEEKIAAPFTDSLTGVYNYDFFVELLSREMKRSRRLGVSFSLAMIDIDGFDRYNEEYGPIQGDWMIKAMAGIVHGNVRETDVVARSPGDGFVVLLSDTALDDSTLVLERIRSSVNEHFQGSVAICIGCASAKESYDKKELIKQAEEALASAKVVGRDTIYTCGAAPRPDYGEAPLVLVVDDEPHVSTAFEIMLEQALKCKVVKAANGEEALELLRHADVSLVLSDVMMPIMDGIEMCRRLKQDPAARMVPVIMVTALDDTDSKVRAIENGAEDFITKPVNGAELIARVAALLKTRKLNESLVNLENVLFSLASAVEAKDAYTVGHIKRVSRLAIDIGKSMGLSRADIESLRIGGILHDIGKIGVPDSVLNKHGSLSASEWAVMKTHPNVGCRVAEPLRPFLKGALEVIRHHHERMDGTGYPDGIGGDDISIPARIMAVADVYDALTSDRPYHKGVSKGEALTVIQHDADEGRLDPAVVKHLIALLRPVLAGGSESGTKVGG